MNFILNLNVSIETFQNFILFNPPNSRAPTLVTLCELVLKTIFVFDAFDPQF